MGLQLLVLRGQQVVGIAVAFFDFVCVPLSRVSGT